MFRAYPTCWKDADTIGHDTHGQFIPENVRHRVSPLVVLSLLSGSLLVFVMQFGMISVALDELIRDLDAPIRWGGWVLTIFMIAQAVSLAISGRLAERFGARNVFAIGFGIFGLASLLCGFAPDIYTMIVGRFLQGLGGGALIPTGIALVAEAFPETRARAVGMYSSLLPLGAVLGPIAGGVIVDFVGWRWTFLMNVPLGVLIMVAVLFMLAPGPRREPQPIDILGVVLLTGALGSLMFVLTELGRTDPGPDVVLVILVSTLSVALWTAFALWERFAPAPALDLAILGRRDIFASNAVAFVVGMCWMGAFSIVPFYVQLEYEMSASASGVLMAPRAAAMAGLSMLAAIALYRTGYRPPIMLGLIWMAASLFLLALGVHEPSVGPITLSNFWWLLLVILFAGAGRGIMHPALINAGMDALPDRIAAIAGLRSTFESIGATLGIAVMVLFADRYPEPTSGMQFGFALGALLLVLAIVLVPLIPELPGAWRSTTTAASAASREARGEAGR